MVRTRAQLYVVRHADAGIRGPDPDDEEPLSFDKGVVWVLLREGAELSLIDQVVAPRTSIGHACGRILREKRVSADGHDRLIQLPRRSAEDGQQRSIEEEQEAAFG